MGQVGAVVDITLDGDMCELDILPGYNWEEHELTLVEKTMDNLQVGDVIEYNEGFGSEEGWVEQTVLAVSGRLVALATSSDEGELENWYTVKLLEDDKDYRIKNTDEVKEMTVGDVEKLVGQKVKIVK
jgi:hypothetical protein